MLPVLRVAADGAEHSIAEARERVGLELNLSTEDLAEKLKNGTSVFGNRVAMAVMFLKKAKLLASSGPHAHSITARGRTLLGENLPEITLKTLKVWLQRIGAGPESNLPQDQHQELTMTPEEQFEDCFLVLRDTLAAEVLGVLTKVSPQTFEQIVVDLLIAMGYGGTLEDAGEVVGKSGDGGIDGTIKQDKLGLETVYVQAKRWQGNVGSPEVMRFCGSLTAHHANKGVMITTSHFSKDAHEYVIRIPQKIVLIGGRQLAELMIDHDVGVARKTKKDYTLKRLDKDYFESVDS